jgi:hypothetical protein
LTPQRARPYDRAQVAEHDQQPEAAVEPPVTAPAAPTVEHAPAGFGHTGLTAPQASVLGLQRSAGNTAVSALMRSRSAAAAAGSPLPPSASAASALLGGAAAEVRVHQGPAADAKLSARPGALAVTEGSDIHVATAAPALDSPSGRLLLAHEAAHVVQQRAPGPAADHMATEAEADQAAVDASLGRTPTIRHAGTGLQYFEAPKHSATLRTAMDKAGFSDKEQDAAYFGNWCRDLSQALVPALAGKIGPAATFQLVNLMAIRHFGHGVTPAQLGAYSTREHIDNPAGTTASGHAPGITPGKDDKIGDILDEGRRKIEGYPDTADPITGTPQSLAQTSGEANQTPEAMAQAFAVNEAGIPGYIQNSKQYILEEYEAAKTAGRNESGLYHVGNFSHTCEDLFAHSNFVEIAMGRLITEKVIKLPELDQEFAKREAAGEPPIETYAAEAKDKSGNARPILSTGTFTGASGLGTKTGHDTFISIGEELKNLIEEMDPFREEGDKASNWDFLMLVLDKIDAAGDEGSLGAITVGVLDPLIGKIDEAAASLTKDVDSLEGGARETFGDGVMGDLAAGAAGLLGSGVHAVVDPVKDLGKEGAKALIKAIVDRIGKGGISLAKMAVWYQQKEGELADAWQALKDGVRQLPQALVALILPELIKAEREFHKQVKTLGSALYDKAVRSVLGEITSGHEATNVSETNVGQKYLSWAQELSAYMRKVLVEVGGRSVDSLAGEIPVPKDENDPAIHTVILYAENTFPGVLHSLVGAAKADAILLETGEQAAHLKQLEQVPDWARAGASHSQISKDHATSPFFGVAFTLANVADTKLMALMKEIWGGGPAPGMDEDYGEKKDGKQVLGPDGRPKLKNEAGLSEWEKEIRKRFLENRGEGYETAEKGVAPDESIGKALSGMAHRLQDVIKAYPIVGPALQKVIDAINRDPDGEELIGIVEQAEKDFDEYANSGELDDDVMHEVDHMLALAKQTAADIEKHVHHHDEGAEKKKEDEKKAKEKAKEKEDPDYGLKPTNLDDYGMPKKTAGQEGDEDVRKQAQITKLDKYRGKGGAGEIVEKLRAPVDLKKGGELDKKVAQAGTPDEKFKAELDRIFGHPYDTNWWVEPMVDWAGKNQHVLVEYIKDRNSGKGEVH